MLACWLEYGSSNCYAMEIPKSKQYVEQKYKEAWEYMLFPTGRVHVQGCMHSHSPKMIIANTNGNEDGLDSGLAISLYFRRCDGSYKNVKGDKLAMGDGILV